MCKTKRSYCHSAVEEKIDETKPLLMENTDGLESKKDGGVSFFWGRSGETESGVQDLGSPRISGRKCEIVWENLEKS